MPEIAAAPAPAPAPEPAAVVVDEDARRFVADSIAGHPGKVVMFAMSWCEFCWAVRKLLDALDVPFVSIDLDLPEFRARHDVAGIRAALAEAAGAPTIPQIFAGGELIGGCMDIMQAAASGELQKLLCEKGIRCDFASLDPYQFLPNWVKLPQPLAA
jgi:cysteine synthase A